MDVEVRAVVLMAWRLAGSAVDRDTWRRRDLNFVLSRSREAVAESCRAQSLLEMAPWMDSEMK